MNHVTHPLSYADINSFLKEICKKYSYIEKYRYRLQFDTYFLFFLVFLESLNIILINMVITLMISGKIVTLAFL